MPPDSDQDGQDRAERPGKLIDMSGHRAAERALDEFAHAEPGSPAYHALLSEALTFGTHLMAAIIRRLDSSRPESLCTLSPLVAAYPSRAEAVHALLRAAFDRRNGDHRRLGAMLLANRYFGLPLSEDFLSSLRNAPQSLAQSLLAVLNGCEPNHDLRRSHVVAFLSQSPELLYVALEALAAIEGDGPVAAMRLLALYPDPELQSAAIGALAARGTKGALRSLMALQPNLPPEADRAVSRLLRKGRLSGAFRDEPAGGHDASGRALLSAIDGRGNRVLWLQVESAPEGQRAIGLLLKELTGLSEAISLPPGGALPPRSRLGTLHPPILPPFDARNYATASCLEVPYGYGLRVLREAVRRSWASGMSLPVEYQMSLYLIWGDAPPGWEDARPEETTNGHQPVPEEESSLLANPLLGNWYLESGPLYLAAQDLLAQDVGLPTTLNDESWRALLPVVIKLARSEFGPEVRRTYAERLKLMSAWFALGGQRRNVRLAASAARTMLESPPEANLFVIALVEKGILVALENLASGHGWHI